MIQSVPVTRVPQEITNYKDWTEVQWGRWKWKDHITLGEGRAALRLLHILAGMETAHEHIVLSLQDNMALAGAWAKGRSPSQCLNFILRRKSGLCLASGILMLLPWVQSHLMPADHLSRLQ